MALRRLTWRGRIFNQRTIAMLTAAEKLLRTWTKNPQATIRLFQGSYNGTAVSASAGTHAGGGAVDLWVDGVDAELVVKALRTVGFAAWHREAIAGLWGEHIHAIAIGDPELAPGARTQVAEYYAGQNGLANHGHDDGPRIPIHTWEQYRAATVVGKHRAPAKPAGPVRTVVVKRGQTLGGIAAGVGLTLAALLGLNPGLASHPNDIVPGDPVTVPATPTASPTVKPTKAPTKVPTPSPAPSPTVAPSKAPRVIVCVSACRITVVGGR